MLPHSAKKTHWPTSEPITVLDRKLHPNECTMIAVKVGATDVTLPKVVVANLPPPIDLLLGSDWRHAANVNVTFHPSNDVTVIPLSQFGTNAQVLPKTAEALIASFVNHGTTAEHDVDKHFIAIHPKVNAPDSELQQEIDDAVEMMTPHATSDDRKHLRTILTTHHQAFSTKEQPLGTCPHTEHSIQLRDSIPVSSRPYRCSPADRQFMREQVHKYLQQGIIRKSDSEYAAPTIVVDQPHHPTTPRMMVHDYRKLNEKIVNPPYNAHNRRRAQRHHV